MNKYVFYIEGQNFWLRTGNDTQKCDMFATKHIEAKNVETAISRLNRALKNEPELQQKLINLDEDPPKIRITQIDKVDRFEGIENQEVGMIFMPEAASELDTIDTVS